MNKLDRIKNLENELAELKAEIIEEEKTKDWNPDGGGFLVCSKGKILSGGCGDEDYRNFGVEFDDEQQAKQSAIAYRRYHRLYRLGLELNDGWVPSWNEYGYCICDNRSDLIISRIGIKKQISGIYFRSEKLAQKAIEILGDELL